MSLYDTIAPLFDTLFPVNPASVAAIEGLVPHEAPRRILDLGAATGGHARAFGSRGWDVLGIEINPAMVQSSRGSANVVEGSMLDAESIAHDMYGQEVRFGAVLCLGNTLPHIEQSQIGAFLSSMKRLLAAQAPLVVQTLNYAHPSVGPGFAFPDIVLRDDIIFSRHYERGDDARSLKFVTVLKAGGFVHSDATTLYPLTSGELRDALARAGFEDIRYYSGWDLTLFNERSDLYQVSVAR